MASSRRTGPRLNLFVGVDSDSTGGNVEEPFPLNATYLAIQCWHQDSGGVYCQEPSRSMNTPRVVYPSLEECKRIRDMMNGPPPTGRKNLDHMRSFTADLVAC